MSIEDVAACAGIGKTAMYRRVAATPAGWMVPGVIAEAQRSCQCSLGARRWLPGTQALTS
jgi:hypothetical protein